MEQPDQQQQPALPDAPDKETMEQIRRRRVAKLGAAANPTTTSSSDPSPKPEQAVSSTATTGEGKENHKAPAAAEASRTKINITPAVNTSEPNPVAKLATVEKTENEAKVEATSSGIFSDSRKRRATDIDLAKDQPAPPPRKQLQPKIESLDDFANNMLGHIFRVTADPNRTTDTHGHKLAFLPQVSQDLQESGAPLKLSIDVLDGAIVEAATATPQSTPILDYLLPCWKRVTRAIKLVRNPTPEKLEVLKEARRICFSNCIFALTMPELYRYFICPFGEGPRLTFASFPSVANPTPSTTHCCRTSSETSNMTSVCATSSSKRPSPDSTRTIPLSPCSRKP
jgi:ubiquitin conjugation factor E4 B